MLKIPLYNSCLDKNKRDLNKIYIRLMNAK